MSEIRLTGYQPGGIGWVTQMHGSYYHRHWDFDLYFETKVARGLCDFLARLDPARDGFWLAWRGDDIVGSITIDGSGGDNDDAHLRFFIVAPDRQGLGIGRLLMQTAVEFCRGSGAPRVYLWTFAGLDAARRLYEAFGFRLVREQPDRQWGRLVNEQLFERILTEAVA